MKDKYYFTYGGTFKKILSKFISLLYNALVGCIVIFVLALILSEINYLIKDILSDNVMNILKRIEIYLSSIVLVAFIIPSFLPQKVEIKCNTVKIHRHCLFLSVFMISRGFNDTIPINSIENIYIAKSKDKFFEPIPVNFVDWNNMVVIEAKNKHYYAPIENSDEFIEKINKQRFNKS
jgi:hypothetical protein